MKIVKKRIAVILALVMLVSSVVPITPAYAFTPDSSVHLVRNPADPTPIVTGGVPSDTHLLHWPILMDTSYRMSYFITDNVQVVLTIFPSTTSGALEVFLDVLNNGVRTNAAHNNFSIHLDAESPFTTPDVFIESRPGVPGAMAYDWRLTYGGPTLYAGGQGDGGNRYNAGPPRSYITPMFWLTQGTGFSFRYNIPGLAEPVDFHIGWNLDGIPDADFVFSANGLRLGRIYEFNLETATNLPYNPDDPDWGNRRVQRVVRGIDLARVGVEPRSNYDDRDAYLHAAPGNSIAQPSPQVFTSGRVPRDAVIFMEDLERDKNPGSQGVSLELRIPVPDALHHPPDNVFTTAAALDLWEYEDIPLEMTIQIPGLSTTISIENILYSPGDDLVLLNESMPAGLQFIQPPHRTADGYIVFELANVDDENPVLLPSMWFGLLHISLHSPNQDIATPPPHDPQELNNAHTLLEYWPSAHGEEYYIVIRQFRSSPGGAIVHGNYHIFMHPTTGLPPPVNILTEGHIILPHNPNSDFVSGSTRINVMSPEDMSFRVLFVPFQPSTGTFGSMVDAIISQILRFIPLPGVAQIQTPETFNIVNSGPTVQPPHTPEALRADRDRGEVELQLSWDLGGQYSIRRMLEATDNDLELVYEIGHSLTHDFGTEVPFARLEFNITSGPGIGVDGVGIDWTNPPRWVPLPDGDSRVPQPSPLTPYNVRIRPHLGRYVLEVDFTAATYHNYFERTPSVDLRFPRFFYPNVYFLNVRPVYSNRVAVPDNVVASRFDSFTLSDISMPQVPVPQDLVIDNEQAHTPGVLNPDGTIGTHDQVSFDLRWQVSRTALRNFVRYAYRATPSALTANIYISADEDAMRDFVEGGYADQFKVDNGAPNGRFAGMPTAVFTPSGNHPDTLLPGMFFSDIDGHTAMTMYPPSSNDPRYYLRQTALPWGADIIRVTGVSLELTPELLGEINQWLTSPTAPASPPPFNFAFTLDGLDKGERYYVFVDFAVSFDNLYSEVGAATVEVVRDWFSMLSVLVGVTMPGDPDVPSGEDRVPTAPELFVGEVTSFSGEVYWPPIADADAEADPPLAVLQYEIIRIHNAQLDAAALQEIPTRSFQGFWEEHVADIAYSEPFLAPMGWRTYNLEEGVYTLREWGGDSFGAPIDLDDPRFYFTYTTGDVHGTELPVFMITDNTLRANELYFYYVRTVRRNSAGQYQYSVWSRISLTTTPIEPPINLRVAPETADFDPFTQIWLRFDAPMPMSSLSELGTPDGLRIELQVRREDDQWMDVRELDADTLRTVPSAPEVLLPDPATGFSGGYRFRYLVTGLDPGTSYQFRVRIVDSNGVASLFSNVESWRTEFDQAGAEDDRIAGDWMEWLRREMERLLRTPYWVIANTEHVFEVIFRPTMTDVILATPDSHIRMPSSPFADVNRTVYHIPMSVYTAAAAADRGFVVTHGDMQILLPPGFIDLANNPAVLAMRTAIDNRDFADSTVRVSITWADVEEVDGNEALSRAADVGFEIIGTNQGLAAWDRSVAQELANSIERWASMEPDSRYLYFEAIRNAVRSGTTSQDISRYALAILEVTESNIVSIVNGMLAGVMRSGFETQTIERAMFITIGGLDDNAAVQGFTNFGAGWLAVEVNQMGQRRGFTANRAGRFLFTGRIVVIPGIGPYARAGTVTGIVARYGLDDFMGREVVDINATATRQMVVGSVARLSGAPRGADPVNWLRQNDISVQARGMGNAVTGQEAVALMMHVYDVRTGTSFTTIRVRNNNALNGLDFDQSFAPALRAAIELEIIDPEIFRPREAVQVRDLLTMLDALDRNVRIR